MNGLLLKLIYQFIEVGITSYLGTIKKISFKTRASGLRT